MATHHHDLTTSQSLIPASIYNEPAIMARITDIEDSEDEFPEVAELLKSRRIRGGGRRREMAEEESILVSTAKSSEELATSYLDDDDIPEPKKTPGKPRKRVLKQTTDNPLLRSITGAETPSSRLRLQTKGMMIQYAEEDEEEEVKVRTRRTASKPLPKFYEDGYSSEEERISDFVVSDDSFIEGEEVAKKKPPRSVKRLVKGRKPERDASPSRDLGLRMEKLTVEEALLPVEEPALEDILRATESSDEGVNYTRRESDKGVSDNYKKKLALLESGAKATKNMEGQNSNIKNPSALHLPSPHNKPRKASKETRATIITPPGSPERKPKGLVSPSKRPPRIPLTPHHPNTEAFWSQDIINDWNDEYSPRKEAMQRSNSPVDEDGDTSGGTLPLSPSKKTPVKQTKAARDAKKAFSEKKDAIARSFLAELDEKITNNQISSLCAETGGVAIVWSNKLCTTAGLARWQRETVKSSVPGPDGKLPPPTYRHYASIELAEKVIDDEDRLINIIAHEFCHLANFIVSNINTNPHGKEFKAWAKKCSQQFGHRGIVVTTLHYYDIDYKYVWECENCGVEFKRHSKSIDPARHRCGTCESKLVQIRPVPRVGGKVTDYQLFVKENILKVWEANPGSQSKVVMGLIGKMYKEAKAAKAANGGLKDAEVESASVKEDVSVNVPMNFGGDGSMDERETSVKDDKDVVGDVVRKLDFLDLTGH